MRNAAAMTINAALYADTKRALLRRSFADFVVWAWPRVSGKPFLPNAITEQMIAVLQRVGDGELSRVLIAMPPGVGKSMTLACYSAWRLARDPSHRAIHAGHAFEGLAKTESIKVRRLVEHEEFRALFRIDLRDDENTAGLWATSCNGIYIALGTDVGVTGKRVREAVIDDPMDAQDRYSRAAKEKLWTWYTESLLSRLDGDDAPIIVVAQRLDRDDLIGKLLESGEDWFLLELPAELEDGTLLAPNVLSRKKLDVLRLSMGAAAFATQFLQRPGDASNSIVQRTWWRFHRPAHVLEATPRPAGCDTSIPAAETPGQFTNIVIAVDMTFGSTSKNGDFGVVQAWGARGAGRYLLAQWRAKASQMKQHDAIRAMRALYPTAPIVVEKAAGGDGAVELLTAEGFTAVIGISTGGKSKAQRFDLVSPAIEAGNCYLPLGAAWLGEFVEELSGATKHDDMMDTAAYALAKLAIYEAHDDVVDGGYTDSSSIASHDAQPVTRYADTAEYAVDRSDASRFANFYSVDFFGGR
jgi:phage terminase large subunit-like protein